MSGRSQSISVSQVLLSVPLFTEVSPTTGNKCSVGMRDGRACHVVSSTNHCCIMTIGVDLAGILGGRMAVWGRHSEGPPFRRIETKLGLQVGLA